MNDIQMIPIAQLKPHPDNPRKDVGDITELIDSIKKNGIMQNLTVVPVYGVPTEQDGTQYYILIGNRRYAAAKEAFGLSGVDLPCQVVKNLSRAEQVSIMLEENMQREDLTIGEQAHGFQMMLDLGETVESIAEKTGFSKTTVKHRIELAKLDEPILDMVTDPEGEFQINLKTLQMLEQIDDIEKRNNILRSANRASDIAYSVNNAVRKQKAKANRPAVMKKLRSAGIVEAPQKVLDARYGSGVEQVALLDLSDAEACEAFEVPSQDEGPVYWFNAYNTTLAFLQKPKRAKKEKTLEEIQQAEARKKFKEAMVIMEDICTDRADFVRSIIKGDVTLLETGMRHDEIMGKLLDIMIDGYVRCDRKRAVAHYLQEANPYRITDEQVARVFNILTDIQKMVLIVDSKWLEKYDRCHFKYGSGEDTTDGKAHRAWIDLLGELYLFRITDPVKEAVLNGSSNLYTKKEVDADA